MEVIRNNIFLIQFNRHVLKFNTIFIYNTGIQYNNLIYNIQYNTKQFNRHVLI